MDSIVYEMGEDDVGIAKWITLDEMAAKGLELYPQGLKERLGLPQVVRRSGRRFS